MAVAATRIASRKFENGIDLIFNLALTGNYPGAPGEVLDLGLLSPITNRQPKYVTVQSKTSAVLYTYDKTNKTIRVWTNSAGGADAPFAEHSAAAYIASILADTQIELVATFTY